MLVLGMGIWSNPYHLLQVVQFSVAVNPGDRVTMVLSQSSPTLLNAKISNAYKIFIIACFIYGHNPNFQNPIVKSLQESAYCTHRYTRVHISCILDHSDS